MTGIHLSDNRTTRHQSHFIIPGVLARFSLGVAIGIFATLPGCAYRFTNTYAAPPVGVRTIAIEAIYDTSREVLPHEILWQELQKAFAANGRLVVVSQGRADALVRAHIRSAQMIPSGDEQPVTATGSEEPQVYNTDNPASPFDPKFQPLTRGANSRNDEVITLSVDVEVLNLTTHQILLTRNYPVSGAYRVQGATGDIPKENFFVRSDESLGYRFAALSQDIANRVVLELMTTL